MSQGRRCTEIQSVAMLRAPPGRRRVATGRALYETVQSVATRKHTFTSLEARASKATDKDVRNEY